MAQSGFTPIQLYFSTTAAATPSAGNLANGELAVNITDGKLFYKDNGGVVRVLATAAGSAGDVVGPGSSTDNALVRFDGTTGKLVQSSVGVLSDAGALSGLTSVAATTFTGALTGNASTATTLQTSRTIWGQSFDGSANVTGALTGVTDLTASGLLTLNAGTANGVAYLNGSKVLTTGSALTFDGTNFGIGTSSPAAKLDVSGTSRIRTDVSSATVIATATNAAANAYATYRIDSNDYQFYTTGSEKMRIDSSGNVGIGTSSPAYKLHVANTATNALGVFRDLDVTSVGAAATTIELGARSGATFTPGGQITGVLDNPATTGFLTFSTRSSNTLTERARIDSSGNLLVGGTSALNTNARLSVWNSAGSAFGIATGYGTASGQFRLIYLTSANNALNFDNGSNNATLTSGGAWTNASDARIKTNIQDIKYGLETVLSAKPRSYNRIDVDGDHIGFVAQELLKVIPEVVFGGDETKYSVDYGSLVAVAFKAIQEQQAIITQLKADVAALKGN